MADAYLTCSECTFVADNHRSFKLHSNRCPSLVKITKANEESLRHKWKKGDGRGMAFVLGRIRASKVEHTSKLYAAPVQSFEFQIQKRQTHNCTIQPALSVSATSPLISTSGNPGLIIASNLDASTSSLVNSEPAPALSTISHPTYEPILGRRRYEQDVLPEAPAAILELSSLPIIPQPRRVILRVRPAPTPYSTPPDAFGQFRVYVGKPKTIPDSECELQDYNELYQVTQVSCDVSSRNIPHKESDIIAPCPNISTFRLQHWHWNEGSKKSIGPRESLVKNVLSKPDFVPGDVSNIDWRRLDDSLAAYSKDSTFGKSNTSVPLRIPPRTPINASLYKSNPSLCTFAVPMTQCLSLLGVIRLAFTKNNPRFFHYEPYEAHCRDPKTSNIYRVYGEAYESQRMLDAHREVQDIILEVPCELPRCVAAMMFFSDGTLLANSGNAKAWPIRVTFGNLSKYERCRPMLTNHYELAFMPQLPTDIADKIRKLEGSHRIPKALLTHLRRELFHEVWKILLNDEFLRAWRQGVVICCADGITRRVFPRIFSYSPDYLEKILLALIRGMRSLRPCVRCLMPKVEFTNMGLPSDTQRRQELKRIDTKERNNTVREARSIIYNEGRAITSTRVEEHLKPHSYVPTENAFSRRLRSFGFDIFQSLTVDFLHEVELGVWKSVFQHILRILESKDSGSVATFNERFRLIPPFGDGTIHPFTQDVSDMMRPAARNYEDILQCIIPAVEGLLPGAIEGQVVTLLYVLAQWHGLAKLRRHTSATVKALRQSGTRLGHELREFHRLTSTLEIYETNKEHTARQQRARKKAKPRAALTAESNAMDTDPDTLELGRQGKYVSLDTVKFHAIGDYPEAIECFGTMDSISTQTGELLHRYDKRRFARTNGREYLTKISQNPPPKSVPNPMTSLPAHEDLPTAEAGRSPYQIAASQKNPILLPIWTASDPGLKDFLPRLKSHLFACLQGSRYEDEINHPASELAQLHLQYDRIYAHQTLRIHYTSYDVRRSQDMINPSTPKRFVLVPSDKPLDGETGADCFWYARVLGIYHANVSFKGSRPTRMDFLWVRWLARMTDVPGGWETCRLDQVGYFPDSEYNHAYDFIDPVDVIRAAHLIPRFVGNQTTEFLPSVDSIFADNQAVGDWKHYYVSQFVDRDMLTRFIGMAIGHMTHSNAAEPTVGISAEGLQADYEYVTEVVDEGSTRHEHADETESESGNESDESTEPYSSEDDGNPEEDVSW